MRFISTFAIAGIFAFAAGCADDVVLGSGVSTEGAVPKSNGPIELDVLFVVDNSGSMGEEQASLGDNLDLLIDELATLPGGLPSLHIGVVSTDVGTGQFAMPGCDAAGDRGELQDDPRVMGCQPPMDPFIADVVLPDGTRQQNYAGALEDAFRCVGLLGINGCGFEQPLESAKQALESAGPGQANDGFLRDDAYLAVIVISDEDDCSAKTDALFDTSQNDINDPLGPVSSFRCVEFGVRCDGMDIARTPGTYATCVPRGDSHVHHPDTYASFVSSLKANPNRLFVGVIAGDTGPLTVLDDGTGRPFVDASCSGPNGTAYPAYRLRHFAEQFNRHAFTSICNPNLSLPLTSIAQSLRSAIEDGEMETTDPDPDPDDPDGEPGGCNTGGTGNDGLSLLLLGLAALVWRGRRAR